MNENDETSTADEVEAAPVWAQVLACMLIAVTVTASIFAAGAIAHITWNALVIGWDWTA